MKPGEQITLVLIPIEDMAPRYHDEMPTTHFNPDGVPNLILSQILKAPELTVPSKHYSIFTAFVQLANVTSRRSHLSFEGD